MITMLGCGVETSGIKIFDYNLECLGAKHLRMISIVGVWILKRSGITLVNCGVKTSMITILECLAVTNV